MLSDTDSSASVATIDSASMGCGIELVAAIDHIDTATHTAGLIRTDAALWPVIVSPPPAAVPARLQEAYHNTISHTPLQMRLGMKRETFYD